MWLDEGMETTALHYYRTTTARQTGRPITTGHGDDLGLSVDGDGPWFNICDDHGGLVSHTSLLNAKAFAAAPLEWCPECQATAQ